MPLFDHFQPPMSKARHWDSILARWASAVADRLDQDWLPDGYFAEFHVHVGGRLDVATEECQPPQSWTPPPPDARIPAIFPDVVELLVFHAEAGRSLVAAVEFVTPANKDRPEARRGFAARCASYLQDGIGLIVIDIVTSRKANLHDELVALMEIRDPATIAHKATLYAAAYRPTRGQSHEAIDVWLATLAVGEVLPVLPLSLRSGPCVPLDLEATYADLCRKIRLGGDG